MDKSELKTGDLILSRVGLERYGFRAIVSKIIAFFQPAIGEGGTLKKTYSHIAMVDYDINFKLEATFPKAKRSYIDKAKPPIRYEVYRVKKAQVNDGGILLVDKAITWATRHLGIHYDLLQLLSMGLFDTKRQEVCSTYIGKAWLYAGVVLSTEGIKDVLISPNEIVENIKEVEYIGTLGSV